MPLSRATRRLDVLLDLRAALQQAHEPTLVCLLVAIADRDRVLGGIAARRQVAERVQQAFEIGAMRIVRREQRRGDRRLREDARILARIDRQQVLVIANREAAGGRIELQLQLAALQHGAVDVAEHRHEHAIAHRAAVRTPVDVEVMRGARRGTVLQDVEPPGVVVAHHAEMIRHDVDDQSHAVLVQRGDQRLEVFRRAELRIEAACDR